MAFIFHTKLKSLINYICIKLVYIVGAYSNGHVMHQILSASMFRCSLMEMWAWTSVKGGHCLHACTGERQPMTWYPSWETRTAYWVVSDFSMFLLPITGLQLLDSHKLMVLHLASGCTTSLLSTIPENLFILICPGVFLNSDFWVRKPSCYQLSQSCF